MTIKSIIGIGAVFLSISLFSFLPPMAGAAGSSLDVWWPTEGAHVSGVQPFKALVPNRTPDHYEMYWQVDGGQLNKMDTNTTDYPHKEASVDVSGWHWQVGGTYAITFVAKWDGQVQATRTVNILVDQPATAPSSPPAPAPAPALSRNPLAGMKLYVDPHSSAAAQAEAWRATRPTDAARMQLLASNATAVWLGEWSGDVHARAAEVVNAARASGSVPTFVLYNIPNRDCGGYSSGGTAAQDYLTWIRAVASGIGSAPAIVVLEPDALASIDCLSAEGVQERESLIHSAVTALKAGSGMRVYIDAGHADWTHPATMAARLEASGLTSADGFAVNVSNFMTTDASITYGNAVSDSVGGAHYLIDDSRNGKGSDGSWCNPSGRAIGKYPTTSTGSARVDAILWLKTPGESDGQCNGGPAAGAWWPDYALALVRNTGY